MGSSKDNFTIKLPKEIINLIKEMYNLPSDTSHKNVVLYAFATLIPEKGRESFASVSKIDEKQIERMIERRSQIVKDEMTGEFKKLNHKLDLIKNNESETTNSDNDTMFSQLKVIQTLVELLLVDNYSNVIEHDMLDQLLDNKQNKTLVDYAKNKANN
jgi:hypothetical protein